VGILSPWEFCRVVPLFLLINCAVILPNPCFPICFLTFLLIYRHFEHSGSLSTKFGPMTAVASFAAKSEIYTIIISAEICVVVCAGWDPFDGAVAFGCGKEACVDCLARREISFGPMHFEVINQLHVFLQRYRHKSNAISMVWVFSINLFALLIEPLDLVASDTVKSTHSHAVCFACAEEPYAPSYLFRLVFRFYRDQVSELVVHWFVVKLELVKGGSCIFKLAFFLQHLCWVESGVKVIVPSYKAPWHL